MFRPIKLICAKKKKKIMRDRRTSGFDCIEFEHGKRCNDKDEFEL